MRNKREILTTSELIDALGISLTTVSNRRKAGMPYVSKGGRGIPYTWDLEVVKAWSTERGLARKASRGIRETTTQLKGLGLGTRIRTAETVHDLLKLTQEVTALIGDGDLSPVRGNALKSMLAETRAVLKLQMETTPAKADPTNLRLVSEEAMRVAKAVDWIVDDKRREQILAFVGAQLEIDMAENPTRDSGGAAGTAA